MIVWNFKRYIGFTSLEAEKEGRSKHTYYGMFDLNHKINFRKLGLHFIHKDNKLKYQINSEENINIFGELGYIRSILICTGYWMQNNDIASRSVDFTVSPMIVRNMRIVNSVLRHNEHKHSNQLNQARLCNWCLLLWQLLFIVIMVCWTP